MFRSLIPLLCIVVLAMTDELKAQIVSPEVNADRTVTFRLRAPEAKSVRVKGLYEHPDFELTKTSAGIWEGTSQPLIPELHSYTFDVDGTMQIDPSNRNVKKWLTCGSMVEVKGEQSRLTELTDVPHGVVHHHYYASEYGKARGVFVYTPPGYEANSDHEFPYLILMHGYGDDESAWLEVGRANFIVDNLIEQEVINPLVIVIPYGHPIPLELRRSFDDYADENRTAMERDVVDSLIPFVKDRYRLSDQREDVAIAGLSMGGGQSLFIGLRNYELFGSIAGFSSASPQGSDEEIAAELDRLSKDIQQANEQIRLLWIGCGEDDFLLDRNNRFIDWLKKNEVQHTYELTKGGHDWRVWRQYLPTFLKAVYATN